MVNIFLLAGNLFMSEMHFKQPGFTYSACGPFTKSKERIQKFIQTGKTDYVYKNDLDKACFQHDMVCGKYKELNKRVQSDKVLEDNPFEIVSNSRYDGYQRGLASIVYKFFDEKSTGSGVMSNHQFANELHKPIIGQFKKDIQ